MRSFNFGDWFSQYQSFFWPKVFIHSILLGTQLFLKIKKNIKFDKENTTLLIWNDITYIISNKLRHDFLTASKKEKKPISLDKNQYLSQQKHISLKENISRDIFLIFFLRITPLISSMMSILMIVQTTKELTEKEIHLFYLST